MGQLIENNLARNIQIDPIPGKKYELNNHLYKSSCSQELASQNLQLMVSLRLVKHLVILNCIK